MPYKYNEIQYWRNSVKIYCVFTLFLLTVLVEAGQNKWTSNGPLGGFGHPFTFHPEKKELIFARLGGSYRSTNSGLTWQRLPFVGGPVIRVHPAQPNIIFGFDFASWKSTDFGVTWQQIGLIATGDCSSTDAELSPSNSSVIYVADCAGIAKSTDGGETWKRKNRGLRFDPKIQCCPQIEIESRNGNVLYALTSIGRVFKSTNGGESWKNASTGLRVSGSRVEALTLDSKNPQVLYTGSASGIFKTTNAAASWKPVDCPECSSVRQIYIDPQNSKVIYAAANKVLKSTDAGATWNPLPAPSLFDFFSVGSHPANGDLLFIGGFGSGIFRSQDGGQRWKEVNNRVTDISAIDVEGHPARPAILWSASGTGVVHVSKNAGKSWTVVKPLSRIGGNAVRVHPKNPQLVIFLAGASLAVSTDGGNQWEERFATEFDLISEFRCRQCFQLDPQNQNVIYVIPRQGAPISTAIGVAKSTDQGRTWKLVNNGLSDREVVAIAIDSKTRETLFAGTRNGKVFKSINGGKSWKLSANGLNGEPITSIEIVPGNPKVVYLSTNRNIFKSTDGGRRWLQKVSGLPEDANYSFISVAPDRSTTLFAGARFGGLFVSLDAAENWSSFDNNGLPISEAADLWVNPAQPQNFFLGTGRGVFSFTRVLSPKAPVIEQVSPAAAEIGNRIIIRGSNFGPSQEGSNVEFTGATSDSSESWSETEVELLVPDGARTGPLNIQTSQESNPYQFVVLPSSGNIHPSSGPARGGTRVAILAPAGLGGNPFNVLFGSSIATDLQFLLPNIILCTAPAGSGTVDVSITTNSAEIDVGEFAYQ